MKTPSCFVGALLALLSVSRALAADAAAPGVVSKITAVTVYSDRAVVTRAAELSVAPGLREIAFERLPANLVDQSLQVSGSGVAEATILDVTASQTFVEATPNERIKGLEDEINALNKQFRVRGDRAEVLDEQRDYVKRMLTAATTAGPVPASNGAVARPSLEEWQKLYDYSETALGKIATELQSLDAEKEVLNGRKAALEQQLAQLRGVGGRSYKTVVVRVTAARAGALRLELGYSVPNASWAPSYDARVRSAERSVELSYFGVVRQNTGEDWNNVALTLSTARPSLGGGAPALPPWVVAVAATPAGTPAAYSVINRQMIDALGIVDKSEAAAWATGQSFLATDNGGIATGQFTQRGMSLDDAVFAQAGVNAGTTSATFRIATPTSLPSNNTSQRVAITSLKVDSALRYESTPKMREAAYLAAPAVNTSDYPLLAGTMNTFLDSSYVATSRLETAMPGEKFELALGVDEGIGVKRKLVNRFSEDTGISNKSRRVTYEVLVTVVNTKSTPEQVRFREPVPVSRDEKIVVKLITPLEKDLGTPDKPRDINREIDGKLTWRLSLKPGEKREVSLKFSVEYPADLRVAGLE